MIALQTDPDSIEGISAFLEKPPVDYAKNRESLMNMKLPQFG